MDIFLVIFLAVAGWKGQSQAGRRGGAAVRGGRRKKKSVAFRATLKCVML